ncbi:hypothetical protein, partial [Marinobacter salarius]|uniref:hypothetical protein n=2 Tax=Marinobacter salarius TaxID=1420917 RepID=UPI0032EDE72E
DQRFETDHLEFVLLRGRLFEHGAASEKSIPQLQQTPAKMARVCQQSEPLKSGAFFWLVVDGGN